MIKDDFRLLSREMQFNIRSFLNYTDCSIFFSKHCKFILLVKEKEKIKPERTINVYFPQITINTRINYSIALNHAPINHLITRLKFSQFKKKYMRKL